MKGPLPGLLLLTLAGIPIVRAFQAPQADFDNSTSEMRALIERFAADRAILNRAYSDPLAAGRQSRLKDFLTEWQTRLRAMNFDSMSQDGKVDYVLLRNRLDHDLRQLELDVKAQAEAAAYTGFAPTIFTLEEKRRKLEPMNPREAASALTTLAKQVGEARRAAESQLREQASSLPPNRRVSPGAPPTKSPRCATR